MVVVMILRNGRNYRTGLGRKDRSGSVCNPSYGCIIVKRDDRFNLRYKVMRV